MTRQSPGESRDAKHAYCLKASTAKVDWPCYKTSKVFYRELQEGKRSQGGQKKRYKDTLKASLKDFDIPMGSWSAQERSGAALYEKKNRICDAERKRRERNRPPADSMTMTCSTCNGQFRARIGLVSHQNTHQHTQPFQEMSHLMGKPTMWFPTRSDTNQALQS